MRITIKLLVMEFFMNHPNTEFETSTVDDWVNEEYRKAHGKSPRGTSGDIGTLHRTGRLMRVRPGVYKYDPDLDHEGEFQDFPEAVKQGIFHRDDFKCVICGLGEQHGEKLLPTTKSQGLKVGRIPLRMDRHYATSIIQ